MSMQPVNPIAPTEMRSLDRGFSWDWLGVVPFFGFAIAFLVLPSASIVVRSFQDDSGQFTWQNILDLQQP
ncbi:MAG TPA: hypothetical protein V6C88_02435, partial [Chroococcidiopsis sp.]